MVSSCCSIWGTREPPVYVLCTTMLCVYWLVCYSWSIMTRYPVLMPYQCIQTLWQCIQILWQCFQILWQCFQTLWLCIQTLWLCIMAPHNRDYYISFYLTLHPYTLKNNVAKNYKGVTCNQTDLIPFPSYRQLFSQFF